MISSARGTTFRSYRTTATMTTGLIAAMGVSWAYRWLALKRAWRRWPSTISWTGVARIECVQARPSLTPTLSIPGFTLAANRSRPRGNRLAPSFDGRTNDRKETGQNKNRRLRLAVAARFTGSLREGLSRDSENFNSLPRLLILITSQNSAINFLL